MKTDRNISTVALLSFHSKTFFKNSCIFIHFKQGIFQFLLKEQSNFSKNLFFSRAESQNILPTEKLIIYSNFLTLHSFTYIL